MSMFRLIDRIRDPEPDGEPGRELPTRFIADESGDGRACDGPRFGIEAVRVLEELQRYGGSASRRQLYQRIGGVLRGFVPAGVEDLIRLGVVTESGGGWEAVVRVAPGHERTQLISNWSRATL